MNIDKLKQIFNNQKAEFHLVKLTAEEEIAADGSDYSWSAEIVPDGLECLIKISQNEVLAGGAKEGQIWLALFLGGNVNQGFAIRKMVNMKEKMHPKAKDLHTVLGALKDKKIYLSSDHSKNVSENAVLGQALKTWLVALTEEIISINDELNTLKGTYSGHVHPTFLDYAPTAPPTATSVPSASEKIKLTELKGDTEQNKILSELIYLEEK